MASAGVGLHVLKCNLFFRYQVALISKELLTITPPKALIGNQSVERFFFLSFLVTSVGGELDKLEHRFSWQYVFDMYKYMMYAVYYIIMST